MSFNENTRVKIPAILHLVRLGYNYVSLATAKWDQDTKNFTDILAESILRINPEMDAGDVKRVFENVSLVLDNEDLGQAFYNKLTAASGVKLIDFQNFGNNSFHVVTELTFKNGDDEFRPDITLLINGMPLAFIEVKKPNNLEGVLAEREAWVVISKKGARPASLLLSEAQDEALCYGWVDVMSRRIDDSRYSLRFTPRRTGSGWSITNVRRVEQLVRQGRMTQAGLAKIAEARANGQWDAAVMSAQTDVIPADLDKVLRRKRGALSGYRSLMDSRKRQLLHGLLTAKSPATRQRRIEKIVQEATK